MLLKTGTLQKTGQSYFIRPLKNTPTDLLSSVNLQDEVLYLLKSNQTFIHPQTMHGFAERRDGVHAVTLGVFLGEPFSKNERLIAQQTLRLSVDPTIPLLEELKLNLSELGCPEGFMVHPQFRGNRLTEVLLQQNHKLAFEKYGKVGFVSCVDAQNPYSYNVLLQNGYGLTHAYVDPSDNGKTYAFLYHPQMKNVIPCPLNELTSECFPLIQCMLKHGTYIGTPLVLLNRKIFERVRS